MWHTPDILRFCVYLCQALLALLAVFYLRRRELSTLAYVFYGLLAVMLPIIGPHIVISLRPGKAHPRS